MSAAIEIRELRKDFAERTVVDGLTFTARPGELTGFIGANGAGKTTTMRALLGLIAPTSGSATIGGERYRHMANPRHRVGAVLGGPGAHPGYRGRAHLEILARSADLPRTRVDEVLALVELAPHAERRVGTYSLGMQQRLALAGALLGDPEVLILDEPTQGLDPVGIRWLRDLMRSYAAEGRTLLVSSHHLAELEAVAHRLVMIHEGRLVVDAPIDELLAARGDRVIVRSDDDARLEVLLTAAGAVVRTDGDPPAPLIVTRVGAAEIGRIASTNGIAIARLEETRPELEALFFAAEQTTKEAADAVDSRH